MVLRLGQKLKVKSYERLVREYGIIDDMIQTQMGFGGEMISFCDTVITITYIDPCDGTFNIKEDNDTYWWDEDMVIPLENSIHGLLEERKWNLKLGTLLE